MRKKNMSETTFRKQLIREGYWNWLTENPKPININWGIIEANLGHKLSAKSKNALNKSLYKSLYKTILETDSPNILNDYKAQDMAEERNNPTITVDWKNAEKALGGTIPEKTKARFIRVMNGTSFKLLKLLKDTATVCATIGISGTLFRHIHDGNISALYIGGNLQTAGFVVSFISLVLYGISKILANKKATLPDIKPNNNLSKAEINDVKMKLQSMWETSQEFTNTKFGLLAKELIALILVSFAVLFSAFFLTSRGIGALLY